MIKYILISLAMLAILVSIFSKQKKFKRCGFIVFSGLFLTLIIDRYVEDGMNFIHNILIPLVCLVAGLTVLYFISDYFDKRFPEKDDDNNKKGRDI